MILNFKTRKEARNYCWKWNIPLKTIRNTGRGSCPWTVQANELKTFVVGKTYKLVDREGFTTNSHGGSNTANTIQAKQIEKFLNNEVKIISKTNSDTFKIEHTPEMTFSSLRSWEARYFVEVGAAPVKKTKAKPKKVNVTAPVAPVLPVAPVTEDLDQMLDGGSAMSVELDPTEFVEGRSYVLVKPQHFKNRCSDNRSIASYTDEHSNGVYTVYHTNSLGHHQLSKTVETIDSPTGNVGYYLVDSERSFFRELATGTVDEPVSVSANSAIAINVDEAAKKEEIAKAMAQLEDAVKAHDDALQNLRTASDLVRKAARKVAEVSK